MRRIAKSRKEAKKLFENAFGEAWVARELEEVMMQAHRVQMAGAG